MCTLLRVPLASAGSCSCRFMQGLGVGIAEAAVHRAPMPDGGKVSERCACAGAFLLPWGGVIAGSESKFMVAGIMGKRETFTRIQ